MKSKLVEKTDLSLYIRRLVARYRYYFISVVVLASLTAILNTSFGAMLKWLTDGLQNDRPNVLITFIALFALQRFLLPIFGSGGMLVSSRLANKIESDIRRSWYEHVVELDYSRSKVKNSGEYQKKIQEAVFSVRSLLNNTLRSFLAIVLEASSVILFACFFIGAEAGVLLLIFSVLYSIFIIRITKKRMPIMKEITQSDAECAAFMHDSFINSEVISPAVNINRISRHGELLAKLEDKKNLNSKKLFLDGLVSSVICLFASFILLGIYSNKSTASIGVIVMMSASLAQLIAQINMLGYNYRSILSARIDIQRIAEGLGIKTSPNTLGNQIIFGAKNYSFLFNRFQPAGIDNVAPISGEICMDRGVINTLKGDSGIGKSTVARGMRGELRASENQMLINNVDVSKMQSNILLSGIGYVSQDNTIFNESIIQNLQYGKADADEEEIIASLEKVGLQKFCENLDYVVGEKGGLLSGGERQRLVIARGLMQKCNILILDEPFSGLDENRTIELAETISKLASEMYILVILHQNPKTVFGMYNINQHIMEEREGETHIRRIN